MQISNSQRIMSDSHLIISKSQDLLQVLLTTALKTAATSADICHGIERFDQDQITRSDRRMSFALVKEYLIRDSFEQELGNLGKLHDLWQMMLDEETNWSTKQDLQRELNWLKANSVRI